MGQSAKILVLYYSMYGNTAAMAAKVCEGVNMVDGATAVLMTVAELVPDKVIADSPVMSAVKEKYKDVPVATAADLEGIDGLIVGTPTRFGNMSAQMRNFWDRTSAQWGSGTLIGKPAGVFTSTATMHGGQETTILTTMITLLHHGCIIVGVPYSVPELVTTKSGGTPYGPSHTAGPNGDMPVTDEEAAICIALGKRMAETAIKLKG